jgi:tetratricopeptide (TPR) repeat protein
MHYVARNTRKCNLLMLGTYRPEDIAVTKDNKTHPLINVMQMMSREDLIKKMELERLEEDHMDEIILSLFKKTNFPYEFKAHLYNETDGNPFFIISLLRMLIEEGTIDKKDDVWNLTKDLMEANIPSRVYDVIVRRLNRVNQEQRETLEYAAIIGEEFTSEILAQAIKSDRIEILKQLRNLEQNHKLIRSIDPKYKFDHAKIKEVLYNHIPPALRAEYHTIIAQSIEILYKNNLEDVIGDLAYHYYRCRKKEKALPYLIKAAEKAKKDYSSEEAVKFYSQALEFEDNIEKKRGTLENIGDIYQLIADYEKSTESYNDAISLTQDKNKIAEIKVKIGTDLERKGDFDESIEICMEALALVNNKVGKESAKALLQIGRVHFMRGDYDISLEYAKKSLEMGENIGDQKVISGSLNTIADFYRIRGEFDDSLEYYRKSLAIDKKSDDLVFVAHKLNNIAILYYHKGEFDSALEFYENSNALYIKTGFQWGVSLTFMNIGCVHRNRGEYEEALEFFNRSLKSLEKRGDQQTIAQCLLNMGEVYYRTREFEKALDYLEKSLVIENKISIQREMTYTYRIFAMVYCKMGKLQESLDFANKAFNLSTKIGYNENIAYSKMIFGMINGKQKKWKESIDEFEESLRIFNEMGMNLEEAESHFEFALMWKEKGDVEKARKHLNEARNIYEKLNLEKHVAKIENEINNL